MDATILDWRSLFALVWTRLVQLGSSPGYWAFALLSLILVGGAGVWAHLLFDISTEENALLFAFLTYGFAVTGGMLLDMILNRDRNVELSFVGSCLVIIALLLLLNPVFRFGPIRWFTYIGTGLMVLVWTLANVEAYQDKLRAVPKAALGDDGDSIGGEGLKFDD